MKNIIAIVSVSMLLAGCLTISKGNTPFEEHPATSFAKTASVEFTFEALNFQGTRIIFSKEQSTNLRNEFTDVLNEFGVSEGETNPDIKIDVQLRVKDRSCEILFLESNCWASLLVSPLTLYLVPVTLNAEHEITLKIKGAGDAATESTGSEFTSTHIHLIFLPAFPYEFFTIKNASFRRNVYRNLLRQDLPKNLAVR